MRTVIVIFLLAAGCGTDSQPPADKKSVPTAADGDERGRAVTGLERPAFAVEVIGTGQPVLLLPGLGCSSDVWREAVERWADRYQLHLFTLAGFAGRPAIEPPFLDTVRAELIAYMQEQDLAQPVLIGHSLGAFLAFWVAATAPDRVGPVVALDGVPFGLALADPDAKPKDNVARATMLRGMVSGLAPDELEPKARQMFGPGIASSDNLDRVVSRAARSDPATVGQAMYELMTTDLRPLVPSIRGPVLLLVAGSHYEGDDEIDLSPYEDQLTGVDNREVVLIEGARHFVMLDAPDRVYGTIERFLSTTAPAGR